jgi:hypothetical protein
VLRDEGTARLRRADAECFPPRKVPHTKLKSRRNVSPIVTPERKVMLLDGLIAVTMLLNGSILFSSSVRWWVVFVFGGAAVWVAGIFYRLERWAVAEGIRDVVVGSVALAAPVLVAVAMGVSNHPLAETVVAGVFAGFGSGVLGYRIVYGLVQPIPEPRLARARRGPF